MWILIGKKLKHSDFFYVIIDLFYMKLLMIFQDYFGMFGTCMYKKYTQETKNILN